MKIAAIVITLNDDYKFNEWVNHYNKYKENIYTYIIVDNGSREDYLKKLDEAFVNARIIKRGANGGCTGAYNDGIRLALSIPEIDAIMLIGNDISILANSINELGEFLFSDDKFGMVAPILLSKGAKYIEDYGCSISNNLYMQPYAVGKEYINISKGFRVVDSVTGGMNLAKREFYEKVGLQDEKLFMYSDEVDMAIRAKHKGLLMAVTSKAFAVHEHINPNNNKNRADWTYYLINRNKLYLAHKHYSILKTLSIFLFQIRNIFIYIIRGFPRSINKQTYCKLKGSIHGLFYIMSNKFIKNV